MSHMIKDHTRKKIKSFFSSYYKEKKKLLNIQLLFSIKPLLVRLFLDVENNEILFNTANRRCGDIKISISWKSNIEEGNQTPI
jgi:hypothetical protein